MLLAALTLACAPHSSTSPSNRFLCPCLEGFTCSPEEVCVPLDALPSETSVPDTDSLETASCPSHCWNVPCGQLGCVGDCGQCPPGYSCLAEGYCWNAGDTSCDGVDDDGDGETDEDYSPETRSCGVGACRRSALTSCLHGRLINPCIPGVPGDGDATCDGVDDDCNGVADEDFAGPLVDCGAGSCRATGTLACLDGQVVDSCTPGGPGARDVFCNGLDDDCDGQTDEDYETVWTSCGVGACTREGFLACFEGGLLDTCAPGDPGLHDVTCDGVDDDCDGSIDDDVVPITVTCGLGACTAYAQTECLGGSTFDPCVPGNPATDQDDDCDGVDDDCDGSIDDDYAAVELCSPFGCGSFEGCSPPVRFACRDYLACKPRAWAEARDYCAWEGGHLVTLADPDEEDFVRLNFLAGGPVWLGLSDHLVKGSRHWVNEEPVLHDGTTIYDSPGACVALYAGFGNWYYDPCEEKHAFVCELSPRDGTPATHGCADGSREAFADVGAFPWLAGCSGGWTEPGIWTAPACARLGGDDGPLPAGLGCAAADLCAVGWHVCAGADEVSAYISLTTCNTSGELPDLFFASGQSGGGGGSCADSGTDDLFGCGSAGLEWGLTDCGALERWSGDGCAALAPSWACGAEDQSEALLVRKADPGGGGVLCCRDAPSAPRASTGEAR